MRKHDEGYALPFVLVVLLVMCALAIAVMDFSTRNLKAQQTTIWRMQDKYAATGEIEKIYAVMRTNRGDNASAVVFYGSDDLEFEVTNGGAVLRIASFHGQSEESDDIEREDAENEDSQSKGVWVIAAIGADNLVNPDVLTTENGKQKLSINYSAATQYLWYEVVTQETADLFIKPEKEDDRYTPWGVS